MISKKSRKVVAALLIGATVCASGTFAYFNSKADIDNLLDQTDTSSRLNITNGKVEIKGKINGQYTGATEIWSYDVARLSEVNNGTAATNDATLSADALDLLGISNKTEEDMLKISGDYVTKNQSPDILGLTTDDGNKRTADAAIGDKVTDVIKNARPGDAFVLGTFDSKTGEGSGLEVENNSNLTTKIGLVAKEAGNATVAAQEQLNALSQAGWKLYVKIEKVKKVVTPGLAGAPATESIEVVNDGDTWTSYALITDTSQLAEAYKVSEAKPGESVRIKMRLELPLGTENGFQEDTTKGTGTAINGFDLTKLFDIVATQENNPGWNENGSSIKPVTASPSK